VNLSEAAATLIFLLNPDSQWAGDKVLAYKIDELLESPEVHAAAFDSWLRIREDQDVLRVSGFRMNHRLVNLDTAQIYVPLFDDWLEIREARAEMPERDMVWSFSELEADFSEEKRV
jgi:hypothetical protein